MRSCFRSRVVRQTRGSKVRCYGINGNDMARVFCHHRWKKSSKDVKVGKCVNLETSVNVLIGKIDQLLPRNNACIHYNDIWVTNFVSNSFGSCFNFIRITDIDMIMTTKIAFICNHLHCFCHWMVTDVPNDNFATQSRELLSKNPSQAHSSSSD